MNKKASFLIILRPLIWFVTKFIFCAKYEGLENIPSNKNAILAGNHTSILDCLLLVGASSKPPHFLVKKELHSTKIGDWFFTNCGTIPVDRNKKNPLAIQDAKKYLNNGKLIAIFPEGTINRTNDTIIPFKYGAVKLSSETSSPIIPFIIKGKYKIFRKSVIIKFFKPLKIESDLNIYNENLMNKIKTELERK